MANFQRIRICAFALGFVLMFLRITAESRSFGAAAKSHLHLQHQFSRGPGFTTNVSKALGARATSSTRFCPLECTFTPEVGFALWACDWKHSFCVARIITREMMRLAQTPYKQVPFLVNASKAATFGIIFSKHMGFSEIESHFLADFPHVSCMSINHQALLHQIKNDTFAGTRGFRRLEIRCNPALSEIEEGVFHGMSELEVLALDRNRLHVIKSQQFQGLSNLTDLRLGWNRIEKVEMGAFEPLQSMTWLIMHANRLRSIDERTFIGNTKLNVLSMSDNFITELPQTLLEPLPALESAAFFKNPIKSIPDGFFNHSKVLISIMIGCCDHAHDCHNIKLSLSQNSLRTRSELGLVVIDGCLSNVQNQAINSRELILLHCLNFTDITGDMFHVKCRGTRYEISCPPGESSNNQYVNQGPPPGMNLHQGS